MTDSPSHSRRLRTAKQILIALGVITVYPIFVYLIQLIVVGATSGFIFRGAAGTVLLWALLSVPPLAAAFLCGFLAALFLRARWVLWAVALMALQIAIWEYLGYQMPAFPDRLESILRVVRALLVPLTLFAAFRWQLRRMTPTERAERPFGAASPAEEGSEAAPIDGIAHETRSSTTETPLDR